MLNDFKQRNLLVSVSLEDRQNMISANLSMLNERIIQTRSELIKLIAQRDTIGAFSKDRAQDSEIPPPLVENEVVTSLRSQLAELRKAQAEQSSRYGELHPIMKGLHQQISQIKDALSMEIHARLTNLEAEIEALQETERRFESEMTEEKESALALNALGLEYNKLTREVGTTKETYESLLKRRTETALSGLLESNFVSWFEKAEVPTTAVSPSIPLYALLGFGASLTLGLSFIALITVMDNSVRSRSQLEELLGLPVLGALPAVPSLSKGTDRPLAERDLYIHHHPTSIAAEAARSIRTNLLLLTTDSPPKTIMVTSPRAQEGKTTTALALAISMAQSGSRVLVVDTDLRRPRLHKALGVTARTGLTTVLLGEELSEALKATDLPNVDLLPCGPLPPNPAEILHSQRFADLVTRLESMYERIIFDSPPVNYVTDAVVLSRIVSGSVLVIMANSTPRDAARHAARQIRDVGAKCLGVVLNSTEEVDAYSSYQYSYSSLKNGGSHEVDGQLPETSPS
ncbi:MAG: polysaccharide biosynthesis tyrosine autokinase [Deltaproteobacteria bacterium]|nr:polysaccharide biosynthesis tyrosine autokinase [Deltaproteobacteria bacterium]